MKTRSGRAKKPPALMLTSLLDMFTIILIFLIVSFEAEDYEFKLNPDLRLPESSAQSVFKPALNMSITANEISVEEKSIYSLESGKARPEDYEAGQIDKVVKVLEEIYQRNLEALKDAQEEEGDELAPGGKDTASDSKDSGADPQADGDSADEEAGTIIMLQADKHLDYKTLYLVMRSARIAGFAKYRLAIMKR